MIRSQGTVQGNKPGQRPGWYSLSLDNDFSYYYRSFTWTKWNLPLNGCHITFIAGDREQRIIEPDEMSVYMGKDIWFEFNPVVCTNGESFWITCYSEELDAIRNSLGLGKKKFGYHITLGNFKNDR